MLFFTQNGISQILFDDFSYRSINNHTSDTAGSMFGQNSWLTDTGFVSARAWFRGDNDLPEFGPHSKIELTEDGFKLKVLKGYTSYEQNPFIRSTFIAKYGTFASRIKFADLRLSTQVDEAFFLYASTVFVFNKNKENIHNNDEMDFEWNNWGKFNEVNMAVGNANHDYKIPNSTDLKCVAVYDNKPYPLKSLYEDFLGKQPVANQWATCVFVCDSLKRTTKISLRVSNFDGKDIQIYCSDYNDLDDYQKPFIINNYDLYLSSLVIYSIGSVGTAYDNIDMDVDWFYYTERTDLDFDAIEDSVKALKQAGISRINTTNAKFYTDYFPNVKGEFYLDGPSEILPCKEYQWILKPNDNRCMFYDTELFIRYHVKNGEWENWRELFSAYPILTAEPFYDSLEFHGVFNDEWHNYTDTLVTKISITEGNCTNNSDFFLKEPIPNPVKSQVTLEFTLNKPANISFRIFDDSGNIISEIASGNYKQGNYFLTYKTESLSQGIYFAVLNTDSGTEMKRIIISRAER